MILCRNALPFCVLSLVLAADAPAQHPIAFDIKLLAVDANEGTDIADFDGDGKLDVSAGRNWYRNGDWLPRPLRLIEDFNGYVQSNGDFARDVNGDGRPDIVAGDFFKPGVYWYENPGEPQLSQGFLWQRHLLQDTGLSTNEATVLHDIDGDGTPEWITNQWNPTNPLIAWSFSTEEREVEVRQGNKTVKQKSTVPTLVPHVIGQHNGHGFGFGDINNDGREDVIVGMGWYERPKGDPFVQEWTFHPDWDLKLSCPVLVRDLDDDQKNDLIWGNPHDYGLFVWFGRGADASGKLQFDEITVDETFSQAHCIHFADLDGDGDDELLTGKRVRAHNGNDPGANDPPILCYYVLPKQGREFERHIIDRGSVGIGLQIRTADIDSDGDIDIAVAGKEGTQVLFNKSK